MALGYQPDWLLRRKAAALLARAERDPSAQNLEAVRRWREADPQRERIVRSCEAVLRASPRLPGSNLAKPASAARPLGRARPRLDLAASLAAALLVGAGTYFLIAGGEDIEPVNAVLLTTNVGQIRQFSLSDGSKLILDTKSRVRVELGRERRSARVEEGRARFTVAARNEPFIIQSGGTAVRLETGVVDVSAPSLQSQITPIEGGVEVVGARNGEGGGIVLHPGSQSERKRPDWTTGRLSFDGARLDTVIASANRYCRQQILLGDPSIASLRVTGVFRTGDAQGLARSIAAAFSLDLRQEPQGDFVLGRSR